MNPIPPHQTTITDTHGRFWWVCACGDEGGPYAIWERAWDATVEHEQPAKNRGKE